jgi:glycerophosphoryl diester phosphodiesterase
MGLDRWLQRPRPLVIAHRGETSTLPEQTIEAFGRAIELGADMLEGDVQLSRDGQLVMMHDDSLERTTDGFGRVPNLTLLELQALDAGSWFSPATAGLRIPLARDVLRLALRAGAEICLESKGGSTEEATAIALASVDLIRELDAFDAVSLNSFHHESLARARAVAPQLALVPDVLPGDVPRDAAETLRQAQALGAPAIMQSHLLLATETVDVLHAADVGVWVWHIGDATALFSSLAQGVDGVIGGDVAMLVAGVRAQAPRET